MMTSQDAYTSGNSRIRQPARPAPDSQPSWNAQLGSSMPFHRYQPFHEVVEVIDVPDRTWPHQDASTRPRCGARSTCATATRP